MGTSLQVLVDDGLDLVLLALLALLFNGQRFLTLEQGVGLAEALLYDQVVLVEGVIEHLGHLGNLRLLHR